MKLDDNFGVMDFPRIPRAGYVYVLCWVADFLGEEVPFYVGSTDKIPRRMDNYDDAHFTSPRDFIVGTAIRYFENTKKFHIVVKYRRSFDEKAKREADEHALLRTLESSGPRLLNNFPSYFSKVLEEEKMSKEVEKKKEIEDFCEELIKGHAKAS
jgi:hypothetical protein